MAEVLRSDRKLQPLPAAGALGKDEENGEPRAGGEIHVVLDHLSIHTTPIQKWLDAHPTVRFHFTPKGASWTKQIEIWFGIITRQSIRRGTFSSVKVLIKQIRDNIAHWNTNPRPFVWTATAGEILAKGPTRAGQRQETGRQQWQVKTSRSKDTRRIRHR